MILSVLEFSQMRRVRPLLFPVRKRRPDQTAKEARAQVHFSAKTDLQIEFTLDLALPPGNIQINEVRLADHRRTNRFADFAPIATIWRRLDSSWHTH